MRQFMKEEKNVFQGPNQLYYTIPKNILVQN